MFVTHAHTDHIIGALWVIRVFLQQKAKGICEGNIRVYGHDKVIRVIQNMMRDMLTQKLVNQIGVPCFSTNYMIVTSFMLATCVFNVSTS